MPYSHHKAQVEELLSAVLDDSETDAYIFRPCIVAGAAAPLLIDQIPYVRWGDRLPGAVRSLFARVPGAAAGAARSGRAVPAGPS